MEELNNSYVRQGVEAITDGTQNHGEISLNLRDRWVDYAKGIGILLVVYGHVVRGLFNAKIPMNEDIYRWVDSTIYSFHMPLFFFLSGLFFLDSLKKRGWRGLIMNKLDTIIYLYVLWSILQGSIEVVFSRWTNTPTTLQQVFSLLWIPRAHFWFLFALFLNCMFATLIYSMVGGHYALLVVLTGGAMFFLSPVMPDIPNFYFVTAFFVYFSTGLYFKEFKNRHSTYQHWMIGLVIGLGSLVIFLWVDQTEYLTGSARAIVLAACGIAFIVNLCQFLSRWDLPLLAQLGQASMVIYLAHILSGSGARIALVNIFHTNNLQLHILVGCIAAIALPIYVQRFVNHGRFSFLFQNPISLERLASRR